MPLTYQQLEALRTEIFLPEYTGLMPDNPGKVLSMLNDPNPLYTKYAKKEIGIGTILDALGPSDGAIVLDTLESLKGTMPTIKWAFYLLENATLDVGLASTRAQLDALAAANVLTVQQASIIKNLAAVPASKAEFMFGPGVVIDEPTLRIAFNGDFIVQPPAPEGE